MHCKRRDAWSHIAAKTVEPRNVHLVPATALFLLVAAFAAPSHAQPQSSDPANFMWQGGAIRHAQQMRRFHDRDTGKQATPPVIPQNEVDFDPAGLIGSHQPGGATATAKNAFFQDLGTNDRTCFTCHQPQAGWGVSAAGIQARYYASFGSDPIFRLVDGATCPTADTSTPAAKFEAYKLLLSKGLIRVGLPIPTTTQFKITAVNDPYDCTTDPETGMTSPQTGIISMYRRPLPSANLGFLSAVMWDGREPDLKSQARDATLGHAQGAAAPSDAQIQQIVDFEQGVFTAQVFDKHAQDLSAAGGNGGPKGMVGQLKAFFIGINDPLGQNPKNVPFTAKIFDLYDAWMTPKGKSAVAQARASVARGQALFNTTPINITNVAGINDVLGQPTVAGFCGTCHDAPNVGNHSVKAPLDIGVSDAGDDAPPVLDTADLPVFTLQCTSGPLAGKTYVVTDIGRAMISGLCADIGKMKGPILRGLAGRAPYFHNGSAATLMDVVNFYDQRFGIGFTEDQKRDLVAFLNTL
jgi:cytochrome c peroxidase